MSTPLPEDSLPVWAEERERERGERKERRREGRGKREGEKGEERERERVWRTRGDRRLYMKPKLCTVGVT